MYPEHVYNDVQFLIDYHPISTNYVSMTFICIDCIDRKGVRYLLANYCNQLPLTFFLFLFGKMRQVPHPSFSLLLLDSSFHKAILLPWHTAIHGAVWGKGWAGCTIEVPLSNCS